MFPTTTRRPRGVLAPASANPASDRVRATWTSGDIGRIAVGYSSGASDFIAGLKVSPGERVLDVACGTGNLALPAARAGAVTTGIDIAPNLIEQAESAAMAEGLGARFEVGDAEDLPYDDASFDTTVSMFGVMFAAHPLRAAAELMRVTRPGGRIALASWTPTGFIGEMLSVVVGYVPPPSGSSSVLEWGVEAIVRDRLAGARRIRFTRRLIALEYPLSPWGTVRLFRDWYGPTVRAFAALDAANADRLERDLAALWSDHNQIVDGTRIEGEYLEVLAER